MFKSAQKPCTETEELQHTERRATIPKNCYMRESVIDLTFWMLT